MPLRFRLSDSAFSASIVLNMAAKADPSDTNFTVFIRLPFPRNEFVDPPPVFHFYLKAVAVYECLTILTGQVEWNAAKDHALWDILSRPSKGDNIDCM